MPTAITLDVAYDRLYETMPNWRIEITSTRWINRWMRASGDSRATAYRMRNLALAIDNAIFELYVESHPEIPRAELIERHNEEYGLPCPWKTKKPRRASRVLVQTLSI